MKSRTVKQSLLSAECLAIQILGIDACKDCEFLGKRDCGGKNIRKTLLNNKGIKIPVE